MAFWNNNINCANYGARAPISHRLIAGQYRGLGKAHIFNNQTIVNNNFGCNSGFSDYGYYDYGCGCGNNSGSNWMENLFGLGMVFTMLGGLFGTTKKDGAGDAGDPADTSKADEWADTIKKQYPKSIVSVADGNIIVDGIIYDNGKEALAALAKTKKTNDKEQPGTPNQQTVATGQPDGEEIQKYSLDMFTDLFTDDFLKTCTLDPKKGLQLPGGTEYFTDVAAAYDAYNKDNGGAAVKPDLNADGTLKEAFTIKGIIDHGNTTTIANAAGAEVTVPKGAKFPYAFNLGGHAFKAVLTVGGHIVIETADKAGKSVNGKAQTYIFDTTGYGRQISDDDLITNGTERINFGKG